MDILAALLSWLLLYKYAALFAIVYGAAALLPLPANATLLAVGAFSTHGYFNFWISLVIAVVANTLGDLTGYGVTYRWGPRVTHALRLDKFKFFSQLAEEFRTDAAVTVFVTRFTNSLSTVSNFLAASSKYRSALFFFMIFSEISLNRARRSRSVSWWAITGTISPERSRR